MECIHYGSLLSNRCAGTTLLNQKRSKSTDISGPWVGWAVRRATSKEEAKDMLVYIRQYCSIKLY